MNKCESCGANLTVKTGQTYHFTESGVNNVYLENLQVEVCRKCKTVAPYLPQARQLMETIGRALAAQPAPLTGAAVRFLRKQAGHNTASWARLVRADAVTQTRWETGELALEPPTELLHRLVYGYLLAERTEGKLPSQLLERLADSPVGRAAVLIVINAEKPGEYAYRPAEADKRLRRAA